MLFPAIAISIPTILVLVLLCYYHIAGKRTQKAYQSTPRNLFLIEELERTLEPFSPNWFLPTPIFKFLAHIGWIHHHSKYFSREIFTFCDGGKCALDFYPKQKPTSPNMILLVPGLSSESTHTYMLRSAAILHERTGMSVLLMNRRGYCGLPITGDFPFMWTHLEDIDEILGHLKEEKAVEKLFMVGFSMGGNQTQLYLGNRKCAKTNLPCSIVNGAVTISSPSNLAVSMPKIGAQRFICKLIIKGFLKLLKQQLVNPKCKEFFKRHGILLEDVWKVKNMDEFVDTINVKIDGCKDRKEFYHRFSGVNNIGEVDVPMLNIFSEKDIVVGLSEEDERKMVANPNVISMKVRDGGHVSYPHGLLCRNWAAMAASEYILGLEKYSDLDKETVF